MYKFLKDLLKKKEPEKILLAFSAIPAMLDEREKSSRISLEHDTLLPMQNIRNAMAQLQHIINGIAGAEHDPAIHPKLKSIAKNSLPLFVKAMNASLSRELPADIEEFYAAAVESVKGCLNSTRGQGRYLQVVFPEEMKAVKTGIDTVGREINTITSALARYQKEKALLSTAHSLHNALCDINIDFKKSLEKHQRINTRIDDINLRLDSIETELKELPSDTRMKEVDEKTRLLAEKEKILDEQVRSYTALSMTASHVFRKAEKIALKQKHTSDVSNLRHIIDLLSDHSAPDTKDLSETLAIAFPITNRMIEAGDIILKNKEERAIFSDTGRFSSEIFTLCTELLTQEIVCKKALDELTLHPLLARKRSLEREKIQLESMLEKEHQSQKDLAEWSAKTKARIPALTDELNKKIEEIVGGSVQLQTDDSGPVRG